MTDTPLIPQLVVRVPKLEWDLETKYQSQEDADKLRAMQEVMKIAMLGHIVLAARGQSAPMNGVILRDISDMLGDMSARIRHPLVEYANKTKARTKDNSFLREASLSMAVVAEARTRFGKRLSVIQSCRLVQSQMEARIAQQGGKLEDLLRSSWNPHSAERARQQKKDGGTIAERIERWRLIFKADPVYKYRLQDILQLADAEAESQCNIWLVGATDRLLRSRVSGQKSTI